MTRALFLSTPSARRATAEVCGADRRICISIHALCEEGDRSRQRLRIATFISIHALCEEGDLYKGYRGPKTEDISIHALCEEGDQGNTAALSVTTIFLSTPSARRATGTGKHRRASNPISIHALCEEGDHAARDKSRPASPISIHALCEEGDHLRCRLSLVTSSFLSTPSARRATQLSTAADRCTHYFYPRPLRGGRPDAGVVDNSVHDISIHALCEEGDLAYLGRNAHVVQFLSTPSARRATL